jgi:ABC-type dipeptide/oligopeptide/nickel transport system permease component
MPLKYLSSSNVIGDFIAIFIFKSLLIVAVASIVFTVIGIWMGMYFLDKELSLTYRYSPAE